VGWETFFHGKRTHDFPHVRGLTLFNLLRGLFFFPNLGLQLEMGL
jgi:hypothetical protein